MKDLFGKTIVLTRAKHQLDNSSNLFKELNANVIEFPAINIIEPDSWTEFDNLIETKKFDIIIFTSTNAVHFFSKRLNEKNYKLNYDVIQIVAVGSKTAQMCKEYFLKLDFIPDEFSSKGVIKSLKNFDLSYKNILIPQSEIAKRDLVEELKKKNAFVFPVTVYKNVLPDRNQLQTEIEAIKSSKIDAYVFTSPSTFKNFIELMQIEEPKNYFNQSIVAAIGETTKNEIKKFGIDLVITPEISTLENLAIKLSEYFNGEKFVRN